MEEDAAPTREEMPATVEESPEMSRGGAKLGERAEDACGLDMIAVGVVAAGRVGLRIAALALAGCVIAGFGLATVARRDADGGGASADVLCKGCTCGDAEGGAGADTGTMPG